MTLWNTTTSWDPWISKIQNSRLGIASMASAILVVALGIGAQSSLVRVENISAESVGNFMMGICLAVGGISLFGTSEMGLSLSRSSLKKVGIISLYLLATLFLNGFFAPSKSIELANLDIVTVSMTGFWEELLFRGFLFALWAKLFGLRTPLSVFALLIVSSLIFGLFHSNQGLDLFIRSGLGFLFGIIVLYTETVLFAMPLHALHNGLTMVMVYNHNPPDWLKVGVLSLMCTVGFMILIYSKLREGARPDF